MIEKELTSREKWGRSALLESIRIRPKNWRTGLIDPYYSIQQEARRKRRVFCCLFLGNAHSLSTHLFLKIEWEGRGKLISVINKLGDI